MVHHSKYQGSQGMARKLEREKISRAGKLRVIRALQNPQHEYLSFLVCRNPVEKLLSVYNFMRYQVLHNKKNMAKSHPPTWQTYFPRSSPPSWPQFITRLASGFSGYDGLAASLLSKCSPCYYQYDAVIYMETFEEDSK